MFGLDKGWFEYIPLLKTPPEKKSKSCIVYDPISESLLIFGGFNDLGNYNSLDTFSLAQAEWKRIEIFSSEIPRARHGSSCMIYNASLYIIGGISDEGPLNDIWQFDLEKVKVNYM